MGFDGLQVCSQNCESAMECSPVGFVCDINAVCAAPCTSGEVTRRADGSFVCIDGEFESCTSQPAAEVCGTCGCDVFGGGTCEPGVGCVLPLENGEECDRDSRCTSGLCLRDSAVCGEPSAEGEPCTEDVECATQNCTNDGNRSVEGVCAPALGTPCTVGSTLCTRCIRSFSFSDTGICSRQNCAPNTHENCPRTGSRSWTCWPTVSGNHACYEQCPTEREREAGYNCYSSSAFCRDGLCS